jgi:hypothetical protein
MIHNLPASCRQVMDATFEETDPGWKTRMAAVELKLRLVRERVLVRGRN